MIREYWLDVEQVQEQIRREEEADKRQQQQQQPRDRGDGQSTQRAANVNVDDVRVTCDSSQNADTRGICSVIGQAFIDCLKWLFCCKSEQDFNRFSDILDA